MKIAQYKRLILAGGTLSVLLAVSPASVAIAQGGDDGGASSNTSNSSSEAGTQTSGRLRDSSNSSRGSHLASSNGAENESATDESNGSLHDRAKQLLNTERQKGKQHTEQQRQTACKQHQGEIEHRFTTIGSRAQKHLDDFNAIFTKVQAYQTKNQLDVSNYEALVADATAKQAAATAAVTALTDAAATKVDCTSSDPATVVTTVQAAATDARNALLAYKTSLKNLITALLQANGSAGSTPSDGTEGNQ